MIKALINASGMVVCTANTAFPVHPSLTWVDAPDEVASGKWMRDPDTGAWTDLGPSLAEVIADAAQAELTELDKWLPRAAEDLIAVLGIDPATLPAEQQTRLARKAELRAIVAGSG